MRDHARTETVSCGILVQTVFLIAWRFITNSVIFGKRRKGAQGLFICVAASTCYGSISSRCQENYQDAAVKTEKDVSIHGYISSYFFLSVHYLDENGKEIKDEKDDSQRSKSSPDIVSCPSTTYDTSQEEVPNVKKNPTVSWEPLWEGR